MTSSIGDKQNSDIKQSKQEYYFAFVLFIFVLK